MVPLGDSHTASRQLLAGVMGNMRLLTLLQVEFLDTTLVGSNGSALDTDRVLLDSLGSVDSDLVVGLISVRQSQVVVLEVDIQVRVNELDNNVLAGLRQNQNFQL